MEQLNIGTRVVIRDTFLDEGYAHPLAGTVADVIDFDGHDGYVVLFDEDTIRAAGINPYEMPPGGEFRRQGLDVAVAAT